MNETFNRLLRRRPKSGETDTIGEDMVPSPGALAEHSALIQTNAKQEEKPSLGPFSSGITGPVRDFTG